MPALFDSTALFTCLRGRKCSELKELKPGGDDSSAAQIISSRGFRPCLFTSKII